MNEYKTQEVNLEELLFLEEEMRYAKGINYKQVRKYGTKMVIRKSRNTDPVFKPAAYRQ